MYYHSFREGFIESPTHSPSLNIYTVGCPHFCNGCHASDLQNINHDERLLLTYESVKNEINKLKGFYKSICWLGGDPFFQFKECLDISKQIKNEYPELLIVVYTGYTINNNFFEEQYEIDPEYFNTDRKSTLLNSIHIQQSRMPSSS